LPFYGRLKHLFQERNGLASFHALMHAALFFGVIHANLARIDFQNVFVAAIYEGLFSGAMIPFCLKQRQFHQIRYVGTIQLINKVIFDF
jgi:hypothetical protein